MKNNDENLESLSAEELKELFSGMVDFDTDSVAACDCSWDGDTVCCMKKN